MKLPNAENAVVDLAKLVEYCLDFDHPRGKHKARVFHAACGFTADNPEPFRIRLLEAAVHGDAAPTKSDVHGRRFVIEYLTEGPTGRAWIRSAWIIRRQEDFPRFVTAYVL